MAITPFPGGIFAAPNLGSGVDMFQGVSSGNPLTGGQNIFFVDGDSSSSGTGYSPDSPVTTISAAVALASAGGVIYVKARSIATGGTDPVSYAETIIIPPALDGLKIIGIGSGLKQAAQPQVKKGSGSTALLTIRAPGCLISGITFNGNGSTGGGILLDDNGTTKTAEGTIIQNCVFKNCKGSGATDAKTGGAIQIASTGGAWDTLIKGCLFYNNIGGFVLLGTADVVPQDISIEDCRFDSSTAAGRDCDIYGNVGSGMVAVNIRRCEFGIFPAAGTVNTYMDLTKCTGLLSDCRFASNGKTFGNGVNVPIPTTFGIAGNYQDGALIART